MFPFALMYVIPPTKPPPPLAHSDCFISCSLQSGDPVRCVGVEPQKAQEEAEPGTACCCR